MAKELTQEEFDEIMKSYPDNTNRYITLETNTLEEICKEQDNLILPFRPEIRKSQYNNGYYCNIGDIYANFNNAIPIELIENAADKVNKMWDKKTSIFDIDRKFYDDENTSDETNVLSIICIEKKLDTKYRKIYYNATIHREHYKLLINDLNHFVIKKNEHLSRNIEAFYHTLYIGYQQPGNPDYLNILKNQYNNDTEEELSYAANELKYVLDKNINTVRMQIGVDCLCVVMAARAKANQEEWYQLLRKTVSEWVQEHKYDGLEDGTSYIIRHTDTPTTHMKEPGDIYVGITKETCSINSAVEGKDILFIDDIYTPFVNIDEDAIQALFDNKAKSVTFYSIGRTPKMHKKIEDSQKSLSNFFE